MRKLVSIIAVLTGFGVAPAGALTPQETEFFEKQIRPVLAEHCYSCHGPEKQKAELRLDSRAAVLKGSDVGPVVVLGKPEASSLIKSIRHEGDSKMPAKADKLPDEQIAALAQWVKMGLPWPEGEAHKPSAIELAAKTHWSFQPVAKREPPKIENSRFQIQNPIDAFIAAKLEPAELTLASPAEPRTLIRRMTFDLTGLPPTREEVEAFEREAIANRQSAIANLIDRLLASPRYGERWGRYWLDVARYADTKGYLAGGEERHFPFSHTFRDWVIRALNEDLPYDQFLIRQIAADQLQDKDSESLAALGFLTLGRRFLNNVHEIIDDRIDVISRGALGLTVTCARCHDHKFDPISQKDYYALYGVFASSTEPEPQDLPLLANGTRNPEYEAERAKRLEAIWEFYGKRGGELGVVLAALQGAPVPLPPEAIEPVFRSGFFTRKAKDEMRQLRNKLIRVEIRPDAPPRAMALLDKPQPVQSRVFIRGNPGRPGEVVPRRFLSVLSGGNPKPFEQGSGRLELARAIASKDNPLTSRVMVNRIWAHHFGAGLVRTPGDFGVKGDAPTHPELLDWLASRFVEEGWSLKKLHRLIMLSSAYQQSSDADARTLEADPENRLVSRMNRRRLDFEAFRDSMLAVAGCLETTMGGRPVEITTPPFSKRRSVYAYIDRQNLPGVFRTFDFASPDTTSPRRHVTTVPQQALFVMNNAFTLEQARALVARPEFAKPEPAAPQIEELYRRIFARNPDLAEVEAGLKFVAAQFAQPRDVEGPPAWQYGYGTFDEAARKVEFRRFPHWTKYAWQAGPKLPDKDLGHVFLNAQGGHTGRDSRHSAIRRWTAPRDGIVSISGNLERKNEHGDGVLGRVVSSRAGELLNVVAEAGKTVETKLDRVEVKRGETIDFLVDCRANDNSDAFGWAPIIRGEIGEWNAQADFAGPPPPRPAPLTAWEKYAQVLLATNEFAFVD